MAVRVVRQLKLIVARDTAQKEILLDSTDFPTVTDDSLTEKVGDQMTVAVKADENDFKTLPMIGTGKVLYIETDQPLTVKLTSAAGEVTLPQVSIRSNSQKGVLFMDATGVTAWKARNDGAAAANVTFAAAGT